MGGVARVLVVAIACAGCGSFGEADDDWTDDVAGSTPSAEPAPRERPAQTNAAPLEDSEPSVPVERTSDLLAFGDDFGRPSADVRGPWTFERGNLEIIAPPDAGHRLLARSDASFVSSDLVKRLDGVAGDLKVSVRAQVAIAGTFQSSDYCDVVSIWLGGDVLASFYVNGNDKWSSWSYGIGGDGGNGQAFPDAPLTAWTDLDLDLKWDASTVTVTASVNGVAKQHNGITLPPAFAEATPSISVGASCFGDVLPAVTTAVDEVTVTIPTR